MTQTIDPVKLKAAAEHLEWTLKQYPDSEDAQSLLQALGQIIDDAKSGKILSPIDNMKIPGAWNFGNGLYISYQNPSIDSAYSDFSTEIRGGLTDEERKQISWLEKKRKEFEALQP